MPKIIYSLPHCTASFPKQLVELFELEGFCGIRSRREGMLCIQGRDKGSSQVRDVFLVNSNITSLQKAQFLFEHASGIEKFEEICSG
jgi:hypothetical protein